MPRRRHEEPPVAVDYNSAPDAGTPIKLDREYYPKPTGFRRELKKARPIYEALSKAASEVIGGVRVGRSLDPEPLQKPVAELIASVIRHPDAMVWLRKLDTQPSYLTGHSVRVAVLAVVLARAMGLLERRLERAAMAGLLSQIGKAKLPRNLLEKPDPTAEELERIRGFIGSGVELLNECHGISQDLVAVVQHHHERFDGSGYPGGISGDAIPVGARLVGLADWYDAATTLKPYTPRVMSAPEAMDELYRQRGVLFQHQVVEEFIRAMGIYPCGNFVQLNTGDLGLVQEQNLDHRTQPVILLVQDRAGKFHDSIEAVDLRAFNQKNPEQPLVIKRALSSDEIDLDPNEVMARAVPPKKGWRRLLGG